LDEIGNGLGITPLAERREIAEPCTIGVRICPVLIGDRAVVSIFGAAMK
jgi:hypothetical protein